MITRSTLIHRLPLPCSLMRTLMNGINKQLKRCMRAVSISLFLVLLLTPYQMACEGRVDTASYPLLDTWHSAGWCLWAPGPDCTSEKIPKCSSSICTSQVSMTTVDQGIQDRPVVPIHSHPPLHLNFLTWETQWVSDFSDWWKRLPSTK